MTEAQARQLGTLITRARERQGWTIRKLARETEADPAWVLKIERGTTRSPAPELLARLAEALDINPQRIDRITRGHLSKNLPGMRMYFRTMFTEFSDEEIGQVEDLVDELRKEHGDGR